MTHGSHTDCAAAHDTLTSVVRRALRPFLPLAAGAALVACGDYHDPDLHIKGDTRITFLWDEERWEPLGYHEPEGYHVEWRAAGTTGRTGQYETYGRTHTLPLNYGLYEIIAHNNDNTNVTFTPTADRSEFIASCTPDAYAMPLPDTLALRSPILQTPEQVFAYRHPAREVTDLRKDYDFDPATGLWTFRMPVDPTPRTFFYRIEIGLAHNRGRVTGSGGVTVDGLAAQHDIIAGRNLAATTAHQTALRLTADTRTRAGGSLSDDDGRDADDMWGGLHRNGGFPVIEGVEPASVSEWLVGEFSSFGLPDGHGAIPNTAYIHLRFSNGRVGYATLDLTGALSRLPAGGTIFVTLDVDSNIPTVDPGQSSGSGGIHVDVEGWKTEDILLVI